MNWLNDYLNNGEPLETMDLLILIIMGLGFGGLLVLIINHL